MSILLPEVYGERCLWENIMFIRNQNYWSIKPGNNPTGRNIAKFSIRHGNEYIFGIKPNLFTGGVQQILENTESRSPELIRELYGTVLDIRSPEEDHLYFWFGLVGDDLFEMVCNEIIINL